MKIFLIHHTPQADRLLAFSKRTRHLNSIEDWEKIMAMTQEEVDEEVGYALSTIGSSWEFIDFIFLLTDVTRAFTHQLVRHRVGVAFAQQSLRVSKPGEAQGRFGYLKSGSILRSEEAGELYDQIMEEINTGYWRLLEMGVDTQDARGVLPTNIHTNILFKVNLRALADSTNIRLCVRASGEFQNAMEIMCDHAVRVAPWTQPLFAPQCIKMGSCAFPRFNGCPVSQRFPWLRGHPEETMAEMRKVWKRALGWSPQPKQSTTGER